MAGRGVGRPKWVEVTYGLHNLAILKKQEGDLAGAAADFGAKLAVIQSMAATKSTSMQLKFRISDTESWLGTVAEQAGDYPRALSHYENENRGLEELRKLEPSDMTWRYEKADALAIRARILGILGRIDDARGCIREARALIDDVVAHDPANRV